MGLISSIIGAVSQRRANKTNLQIARETNETNRQIAEMNNEANRLAAEKQNQWNIDQWNRENAYNDPAAQASRLRNAGLSAAAAAQGVNGGNASHLESANLAVNETGAPMQAGHVDPIRMDFNLAQDALNIANAVGGAANAMKAFKEAKLTEELIMTDIDANRWQTNMMMQKYFQNNLENPYNLRSIKAQAESHEWRSKADSYLPEISKLAKDQQELNYKQSKYVFEHVTPESLRKLRVEIDNIIQQGKNLREQEENIQADTANKLAQNENIQADTANKLAQNENIQADTANKLAQNENIQMDTANKKQDHFYKRIQNAYGIAGMPQDASGRMAALLQQGLITPQQSIDIISHGQNYLEKAGKRFGLRPDLHAYYKMVINPAEFRKYELQKNKQGWFENFFESTGLPDMNFRFPNKVDMDWQNVK